MTSRRDFLRRLSLSAAGVLMALRISRRQNKHPVVVDTDASAGAIGIRLNPLVRRPAIGDAIHYARNGVAIGGVVAIVSTAPYGIAQHPVAWVQLTNAFGSPNFVTGKTPVECTYLASLFQNGDELLIVRATAPLVIDCSKTSYEEAGQNFRRYCEWSVAVGGTDPRSAFRPSPKSMLRT